MSTEPLNPKKGAGTNADHGTDQNNETSDANARQPQQLADGAENDLLRIKGVNKEVVRALSKVGITSYQKLSCYTPQRLNEILRANDPPVSLSYAKLETIIMKATEFSKIKTKPVAARTGQPSAGAGIKKRHYEKHWENWEELADFFVSFGYEITREGEKLLQTRVINYELDENQQWPQVAGNQLLEWILARSKAQTAEAASAPPANPAIAASPANSGEEQTIQVSNLEVVEIPASSSGESREIAQRRLRADICLNISPSAFAGTSSNKQFVVAEIYLINTRTLQHQLAAYQTYEYFRDIPGCNIGLEFTMPDVGEYRLCFAARLFPIGKTAHAEGPVLRLQ